MLVVEARNHFLEMKKKKKKEKKEKKPDCIYSEPNFRMINYGAMEIQLPRLKLSRKLWRQMMESGWRVARDGRLSLFAGIQHETFNPAGINNRARTRGKELVAVKKWHSTSYGFFERETNDAASSWKPETRFAAVKSSRRITMSESDGEDRRKKGRATGRRGGKIKRNKRKS